MPHKMVNQMKESYPAKASNADESTEMIYLKLKNRDLAKRLAEMQKNYTDVNREREQMQEELFNERLRANAYANRLRSCEGDCRTAITQMFALSETLRTIMEKLIVNNVENSRATTAAAAATPTPKQKTKAVQPMVSGCTISKPTIKIQRITDEQLLQATMNGSQNESTDALQPVVNIRRLPERINFDEITTEDEENELPVAVQLENELLSTIAEQTETSTTRTQLQQTFESENSAATTPRFTSTPRHESASPAVDADTATSSRRSLFVTKRATVKRSGAASASPRRSTRKFSAGSPRVVLHRLSRHDEENNVHVKEEPVSPVKRARRNASKKVTSYKEPPLTRKLRREF